MRICRVCKTQESKIWKQLKTSPICNSCYCKEYYNENKFTKNECTVCGTEESPKWFNYDNAKSCCKCYSIQYRKANKETVEQTVREYNHSKKGRARKVRYESSKSGKIVRKKALKKYKQSEHGYVKRRTYSITAQKDRKKATPEWLNFEHKKRIRALVKTAHELEKTSEDKFHIDHIIPIKHSLVCGLNVPWNLQVITDKHNLFKNNKFDGTYENDSWKAEYELYRTFSEGEL